MIVPSFSALLPDSARQILRNVAPVSRTEPLDHPHDDLIFFLGPGSFDEAGVQYLLPPMKALHVVSVLKERGDLLPIFGLKRKKSILFSV